MRRTLMVLVVAVGLCVPAAGAQAASIVFQQDDGNIYLANADGSGIFQVTLDGDPSDPYGPASQADDGTIATSTGDGPNAEIVLMAQNGTVLEEFTPDVEFSGGLFHTDISPDGSKVAYTTGFFGNSTCDAGSTGTKTCRSTFVASTATGHNLSPNPAAGDNTPSWMTNTRLLVNEGASPGTYDVGSGQTTWFAPDLTTPADDRDDFPDDPEWNPASGRLAAVTDLSRNWLTFWNAPGVGSGSQPTTQPGPSIICLPTNAQFSSPTWSPDGNTIAFELTDGNDNNDIDGEGIWIWNVGPGSLSSTCAAPTLPTAPAIPFAHDPDFGPANVNPAPRPTGPSGPSGPSGGGGGGGGGAAGGGGGGGTSSGSGSGSGTGTGTGPGTGAGGGPPAGASGAATKAIATASAGSLGLTLMAPGTCVPAGQPVDLAVTSATKKAITKKKGKLATAARRQRHKVTYKIKQVTFSLDTSKSVDKRAAFTAAFPSTGMASGSGHRVGAKVALKKSGSRKTTNKSLSGSISIC